MKLTQKEQGLGLLYAACSLFLLPSLLVQANDLLPAPLPDPWLNFSYYCLNFVILVSILSRFLKKACVYAGRHIVPVLGWCVAGFALYYVCNLAFGLLIGRLFPNYVNQNDGALAQQFASHFWPMAIGTVLLVPTAEELMHRAIVFGSLYPKNKAAAYAASACLFSAVHVLGYMGTMPAGMLVLSFLQYLPAGLILAWSYAKSGCIFVPILIHTAVNTMGILNLR